MSCLSNVSSAEASMKHTYCHLRTYRLLDLSNTCDFMFRDCQCSDAQRRIDNGQIDCATDQCPDNCSICMHCLTDEISCIEPLVPTVSPSPTTTSSSTGDDDDEPLFDLQDCESYENKWLKGLDDTCIDGANCACPEAQKLVD